MAIATLSFVILFLLIASGGLLLFYREAMLTRVFTVVSPREGKRGLMANLQRTGVSAAALIELFDHILPKTAAEVSIVRQRLIRAGYRRESSLHIFYGSKVLLPIALAVLVFVTGFGAHSPFFAYIAALGLGFLIPDFWLGRMISRRQESIRRGLPDVLDFLIICIEAGLSMDQATSRTVEELRLAQPALSDELDLVVLEHRAGRARSDAWKQFAERTDVDSVRRLVSVLIQSEQLGTSIAKTLRVHSDTLRTQRRQRVEEKAARTSVKLVFPLVLFIFPSIFLVTLGPEAIIMSESFKKFFTH